MIGLDTNVLVRYYVEDAADAEAQRQRSAARRLVESGRPLMVCKSVILELEWVLRGYYEFPHAAVASVMRHLLDLPHVTVEDRGTVAGAVECRRRNRFRRCAAPCELPVLRQRRIVRRPQVRAARQEAGSGAGGRTALIASSWKECDVCRAHRGAASLCHLAGQALELKPPRPGFLENPTNQRRESSG